jgi:hypothetical protein
MFLRLLGLTLCLCAAASAQWPFSTTGYTNHGEWRTQVLVEPAWWSPGLPLQVSAKLTLSEAHLNSLKAAGIKVDGLACLVTAERTFDAQGVLRLPSDERMSTILTPSGLPIEGGVQGAVTTRIGYPWRTPVDQLIKLPLKDITAANGELTAQFEFREKLPANIPPGIYRVRLDYGVTVGTRLYSLNGETFAYRASTQVPVCESHLYTPPIGTNGMTVDERWVDGADIKPRVPWVLLSNYNSNGYRGVIAEEDKRVFNLSSRNLLQDDVILPLFDSASKVISYTLEPQFPTDTIEARNNIPWAPNTGELTVEITSPDGKTAKYGPYPFVGLTGQWPTTRKTAITAWKPSMYGRYTVKATGWLADVWGNRYDGGGTYIFWIAKRMTLATATFQGMAYPVGNRYGRDIGFAPAVPADVEVVARLYVNSDPNNVREVKYSGKATTAGTFGAAQGMLPLNFDAPGEYWAQVLARYIDKEGHHWVCSMRHAGVVYQPDSPIVARGKKLTVEDGKLADRGGTKFEGYVDELGVSHLAHINFPYQSGDVLLIASEGQGSNKIEPVLNWESKDKPAPWDAGLQAIGYSNLKLKTSNGYSPHLFPEYITDWAYYYGAAPRPGFMGRVLIAEHGTRAPYWPTSPNSFGGQINASPNGDVTGDIYRLIGGVVLREKDKPPQYAGYLSSAFILPGGSKNNRIVAAGSEDVPGPHNQSARFFLVGTRPGMTYEVGSTFAPALQIDPVLPVNVTFTLNYPDGRTATATGTGDAFGSFAGKDRWTLDTPGLYRYYLSAEWEGHRGVMPGLSPTGGDLYVIEKNRPASVPEMKIQLPGESTFDPQLGLKITGTSTAKEVYFAAVMPGAVLAQGYLPVTNGKFEYALDPKGLNLATQTYDVANRVSGKPELADVIHLTFLSKEVGTDGETAHSFARLIVRGNRVISTK